MSDVAPVKALSIAKLKENQVVGTGEMRKYVADLTPILAKTVPQHLRGAIDRVGSSLMVEMARSDFVAKSTALSLLGGLIQVAHLGLELGGPLGQAYLVPYYNKHVGGYEAQFQIGYRGLLTLASRAGKTTVFDGHAVFEGDEFSIEKGTSPRVHHRPSLKGVPTPETMVGCYAFAKTVGGEVMVEWMSRDELEAHRDRYSKAKKDSSPWQTAFIEMSKKTVLRRLAKRLPMSAEMQTAATLDEYAENDVRQNLGALVSATVDRDEVPPSRTSREVADAIGAGRTDSAPGEDPDTSGVPR